MSKKRKHRRRLSSSSEEDGKVLSAHDVSSSHKSVKSKCVAKVQRALERRSADQREKSASSAFKDDSKSRHQVKKHVCRLTKTKETSQNHVKEEMRCIKSRSVCSPVSSSKTKTDTSKKEKTVKISESKTKEERERTHSKLTCTKDADTIPPSRKTSEVRSKKESSRHSPPTSQKRQRASSFVSAEEEDQRRHAKKKKCNADVTSWTTYYSSAIRTKGSPSTSSKNTAQRNEEERIEIGCKKHRSTVLEDKKSSCKETKHSSYFPTKTSSIVAKYTASENRSKGLKDPLSVPGIVKSDLQKTSSSPTKKQIHSLIPSTPISFKIPKKILPKTVETIAVHKRNASTNANLIRETKPSEPKVAAIDFNRETVEQVQSCLGVSPHGSFEGHDSRPSASSGLQSPVDTNADMCCDQMHVVEQLYLARSQRRLEVNVSESYGELTGMDIDPPEEGSAGTQYKQPQQDLILVLDTNVLLSHLDYVKRISSEGLKALGFPCILIPWVVLQELDSLKKGRDLSDSVAHLAIPAISYIYNSLRSRKSHIWGQSMQQAAERRDGLNAENNDDRVLQCCLQYQSLYPECALILCTNDKNLCCKGLLSGVRTFTVNDLKAEAERSQPDVQSQGLMPPFDKPQVLRSCSQVQPNVEGRGGFSAGVSEKDNAQLRRAGEDGNMCDYRKCISELEDGLREVLSDVLEVEMKAIYEELWTEIVCLKPPWTLQDVLKCYKKHWIAVFRYILPKSSQQIVVNLIDFFISGNHGDRTTVSKTLDEARQLVEMLQERSKHASRVLSVMDNISTKLHRQEPDQPVDGESSTFDVVMTDDDGCGGRDSKEKEQKQFSPAQLSHQEVWAMFESIWTIIIQTSMEVFKALGFDVHTMQGAQPAGDCVPSQDALIWLHKLSTTVSQLLQGFSSVLSLTPNMAEVQTLLSVIQSYKIAGGDFSVTPKHLLDCFLQPEYREKLQLGGRQLMDLQEALNRCIQANALAVST